jgi:hypothetical protein
MKWYSMKYISLNVTEESRGWKTGSILQSGAGREGNGPVLGPGGDDNSTPPASNWYYCIIRRL